MFTIYTVKQAAEILNVEPQIIKKWFDFGQLRGYRVPGTNDPRIPREHLVRFARENGMADLVRAANL